jgi:hypothetical protein
MMPQRTYAVPHPLHDKLKLLAHKRGVSETAIVRQAIALYLILDKHIAEDGTIVINDETYIIVS